MVCTMPSKSSSRLPRHRNAPTLSPDVYQKRLGEEQGRLQRIQQAYLHTGDRAMIVLEGYDAAGKGGVIRRMSSKLDPRSFRVWPIGTPNDVEMRQHYLQRFWLRVPEHGHIAVFDRSWYGRVLVERVEELVPKAVWRRAYREINEFERQLVDDGVHLIKVFLRVSHKEQLQRLRERLEVPHKQWKLTQEDFRNRAKRAKYDKAVADMFMETSTESAPWYIIPADNKLYARVETLRCIADAASKHVELKTAPLSGEMRKLARRELGIEIKK
jgi:polyphosphate kinase 2 (PPK2 family)